MDIHLFFILFFIKLIMNKLTVFYIVTECCNLHCPHCIREYTQKSGAFFMPLKEALSGIDKLKLINKDTHMVITGGEPSLHPNIFEIIDKSLSVFGKATLATNAVFNREIQIEEFIKRYKNKNLYFSISIDGDSEIHNKIRGNGTFENSFSAIEKLIEANFKVVIASTVNRTNMNAMFSLSEILKSYKIMLWNIFMEQTFNSTENIKRIKTDEWNSFVDRIIHSSSVPINIKKIYDFCLFKKGEEKYGKKYLQNNAIKNCGFCQNKMYVYPDFSIRACTCLPHIVLGNLIENKADDIISFMKKTKQSISIKSDSPCNECEWKYLCNGGCYGYSYHFKGDIGYGDIRCPKVGNYYGIK